MEHKVYSEIERLKKVLVHSPGKEIDVITPDGANSLLFEDILFGEKAREEHEVMCEVFRKYGVETLYILDLLRAALRESPVDATNSLLEEIKQLENVKSATIAMLKSLPADDLAHALIEGIVNESGALDDDELYVFPPVPNLLFARDPVIVAFDKILASSMAENVRRREALLMMFIFTHHPSYKDPEAIVDLNKLSSGESQLTLEGGDFLVLDKDTVAIAWSKRTSMESIKVLALELKKMGVKNLIVAKLPPVTAFIHLDTTFTRISENECLIYPPLYAKESKSRADIFYFDLSKKNLEEKKYDYIFDLFKDLKMDLTPIYCGGKDSVISQIREQWTQGANSFCIAPGIILTYSRNINTIKELSNAGYLCISAEEVLKPTFSADLNTKTAILLQGEELCRARGGPRCLTHPLQRV